MFAAQRLDGARALLARSWLFQALRGLCGRLFYSSTRSGKLGSIGARAVTCAIAEAMLHKEVLRLARPAARGAGPAESQIFPLSMANYDGPLSTLAALQFRVWSQALGILPPLLTSHQDEDRR